MKHNVKAMIIGMAGMILTASPAFPATTLAVSSSVAKSKNTKGQLLVRWNETGLLPNQMVSYEITGNDCKGAIDRPFQLQATSNGTDGNSIYVGACAPYSGMRFCDVTDSVNPICVDF